MTGDRQVALMLQAADMFESTGPFLKEGVVSVPRLSPPDEVVFNSIVKRGKLPKLHVDWAIFNTAYFNGIYISRAVHIPSLQEGIPDLDVLVAVKEESGGEFERLTDLDLPVGVEEGDVFNWEDPRVWVPAGRDKARALLGLTAVRKEQDKFVPHPAMVEISVESGDLRVDTVTVFDEVGKNTVPIDSDKFIYRPESKSHSFHLLVKSTAAHRLALIREIDFSAYSQVDWMRKKVGTVARPIDIGGNLRLLPIHGVRDGMGIDGEFKENIYSVGFAVIDGDWNIQAVSAEPSWRREDFLINLPLGQGLNGDRKEVVYLDDWIGEGGAYEFPLNVGDRITVLDRRTLSQLLNQRWVRFSGLEHKISTVDSYILFPSSVA